jgi:SAM-dependent methyltransferase
MGEKDMKQPRPQVEKSHYGFNSYYSKQRWSSLWHQLDEIQRLEPGSVLEIGPGRGLFKQFAGAFGIKVETVDIAADLNPDHLATASQLPFADASYDCVCAFQVLEHLPYADALSAFREMVRVTRRHIAISLPDSRPQWQYSIHVPGWGQVEAAIHKPFWRPSPYAFNGEHYWVVNAAGYSLGRVTEDLVREGGYLLRSYRVKEFPAHRFFLFEKASKQPDQT